MDQVTLDAQIYFPGDVFDPPPPADSQVRWRVRKVEKVMETGPWLEKLGIVHQYVLQLYTVVTGGGRFDWMEQGHDIHVTASRIEEMGLVLEQRAEAQLALF